MAQFSMEIMRLTGSVLRGNQQLITEKEAAAMLGCSRWTVWGLIQNRRLRGFSRIARRHAVRWHIPRTDVEELIGVLNKLPVTGESHAVYSLRTFYAREAVAPYEIVERLLKGTLQIATIDPTRHGMYSWRFHVLDMAKPARRLPRWKKPPVEYMTHVEACALTSFHPRSISHLAKVGVLEVPPENEMWLTRASVDAFHSRYVKAWLHHEDLNVNGPAHLPRIIENMGMNIYFRDEKRVCELILSRSELASALGERAPVPSLAAEAVWQAFKESYESGYSAFHMPVTIGTKPQRLALASRRTYFEVFADADVVVIRKTFSVKRPREWRAFDADRGLFLAALKGFDIIENEGTYIAEMRLQTEQDIEIARVAMDAVHWNIRKLLGPKKV